MKFCEHCGSQVLDNAVICSKCGSNVASVRSINVVPANLYKYCQYCGNQVLREAVMCPKCKSDLGGQDSVATGKILQILAKVFMILGAVACVGISIFFFVAAITLNEVGALDVYLSDSINFTLLTRVYFICSIVILLPLFYIIPMIAHYFKATKNKQPVGTAFKICTLLFLNMIAGILMFCDNSESK